MLGTILVLIILIAMICMLIRDGRGFFADYLKVIVLICSAILAIASFTSFRFR